MLKRPAAARAKVKSVAKVRLRPAKAGAKSPCGKIEALPLPQPREAGAENGSGAGQFQVGNVLKVELGKEGSVMMEVLEGGKTNAQGTFVKCQCVGANTEDLAEYAKEILKMEDPDSELVVHLCSAPGKGGCLAKNAHLHVRRWEHVTEKGGPRNGRGEKKSGGQEAPVERRQANRADAGPTLFVPEESGSLEERLGELADALGLKETRVGEVGPQEKGGMARKSGEVGKEQEPTAAAGESERVAYLRRRFPAPPFLHYDRGFDLY